MNKTLIYTFLLVVFLALVSFSLFNKKTNTSPNSEAPYSTENKQPQPVSSKDSNAQNLQYKDSDQDGLYDWEEVLLGTNPNQKDSQDTITQKAQELSITTQADTPNTAQGDTLSAKLTQDLVSKYLEVKQTSDKLDKENIRAIADEALNNTLKELLEYIPTFTPEDITDTFQPSKASITQYKLTLRKAMSDIQKINEYELNLIYNYLNSKQQADLDKIHLAGSYYETAYTNVLKMPAPYDFVQGHVQLANALASISFALKNFPNYEQDPAKAYALIGIYSNSEEALFSVSEQMRQYFEKYGVK